MSRTRNQLWPLFLLVVGCALMPRLLSNRTADRPGDSNWVDLIQIWQPNEPSSAYRFWLPPPQPLQVTLIKWQGGNRNRIWTISIESARDFSPQPAPIRRTEFGNEAPFGPVGKVIGERDFVGSNERLLDDARPKIWYGRHANCWRFFTYQDLNAPGPGPIEIVPREKIDIGQECEYGEGWFSWHPGSKWLACDRNGNI